MTKESNDQIKEQEPKETEESKNFFQKNFKAIALGALLLMCTGGFSALLGIGSVGGIMEIFTSSSGLGVLAPTLGLSLLAGYALKEYIEEKKDEQNSSKSENSKSKDSRGLSRTKEIDSPSRFSIDQQPESLKAVNQVTTSDDSRSSQGNESSMDNGDDSRASKTDQGSPPPSPHDPATDIVSSTTADQGSTSTPPHDSQADPESPTTTDQESTSTPPPSLPDPTLADGSLTTTGLESPPPSNPDFSPADESPTTTDQGSPPPSNPDFSPADESPTTTDQGSPPSSQKIAWADNSYNSYSSESLSSSSLKVEETSLEKFNQSSNTSVDSMLTSESSISAIGPVKSPKFLTKVLSSCDVQEIETIILPKDISDGVNRRPGAGTTDVTEFAPPPPVHRSTDEREGR